MTGSAKTKIANRPNFINVGPGRCASSWLLELLEGHPEISMARVKETEFFNTNYHKGIAWYESLFIEHKSAIGEISNCYYTEPLVAERIREYNPEMRIMINVRNPFTLLNSFHGFGKRRGLELGELQQDLEFPVGRVMGSGYDQRQRDGRLNQGDTVSLLQSVMLSQHLKPFFDSFPANQIYVFIFERLKTESDTVIREIYDFLGVDNSFVPRVSDEVVNAAIEPKSKFVARLATRFAFALRQAGAYELLDGLKKSRLIKKMFYSETSRSNAPKVEPRSMLPKDARSDLEADMKKMIELYPPLQEWWQPLLSE